MKGIIRLAALALAALLMLCGCAGESSSGGEGYEWELSDDGLLNITGTGAMPDMSAGKAPWYGERERIVRIGISEGITEIGSGAFAGCTALTSAEIPESVRAIGDNAFCGCRSLKEITLPDSVEQLGTGVFWDCAELETARVGRGVKELPYNCFCRCGKLKSVTLSEGLEALGDCAFEYCSGLDEIIIPSGVTRFGGSVFSCCGELTLIAPAGSAAEKYAQKNGHGFRAAE